MSPDPPLRFDRFVFRPDSGELIEDGAAAALRLEPQPAKVLAVLLRRSGEVVSREELQREVWPADTFVDFERGLNYCIGRIRTALGETPAAPRYVETLPKRGYRFLVPVTSVQATATAVARETSTARAATRETPAVNSDAPGTADAHPAMAAPMTVAGRSSQLLRRGGLFAVGIALLTVTVLAVRARISPPTVAVALFDNETGSASFDPAAQRLTDAVVERLAQSPASWSVIGNAAVLRTPRPLRNFQTLAAALDADLFVIGQIQPGEHGFVVLTHLIRARDQRHLWVGRTETANPLDPSLPARVAERVAVVLARPDRSR